MLNVKLVKIKSSHEGLRSNEIIGQTEQIPEVGESFTLFAQPLEAGDVRIVSTTDVKTCEYDETTRRFDFTTQNSDYSLYILDDKNPQDYARVIN